MSTAAAVGAQAKPDDPRPWLAQAGYTEVRDLQWDGQGWRATALKNGQRWALQIDPRPVIVATPLATVPTR